MLFEAYVDDLVLYIVSFVVSHFFEQEDFHLTLSVFQNLSIHLQQQIDDL